jgi:peptidyl-prolyl cis-trans isomerase D
MLQSIREKTSGWIATIILGLIILTMALWGIESYLSPTVENYAVHIEGPAKFWKFGAQKRDISPDEFRKRFDQVRNQRRQAEGAAFDAAAFETLENKRAVLDQFVDETLLAMAAERDGLGLSKQAVQKTILDIDAFKVGGKFDRKQYELVLQGQNMTPAQFEDLVRKDLLAGTIRDEIRQSGLSGDADLDAYLRLAQQKRDIRFIAVPPPAVPAAPPGAAELEAWYKGHIAQYRSPERVMVEYVELQASGLPVDTVADEAALRERYESVKSRFGAPEQKLASHILVKVDEKAPAAEVAAAKAKADALAAQARAPGADFAALARAKSDDVGSKDTGGDLGAVEPGVFGAAFDAAFAALQPGQVSAPVRLPDGWHVIQYRERIAGSIKPFEEVRAELESEYLESERERAFNDLSGRLVDRVNADPGALAPAAEELKLPLLKTGWFTRSGGEGVAALEPVRKAAFQDAQKIDRQVSDTIEVEPNHIVVLHVIDHQPAAPMPLASVRDRVAADLAADRAAKAAKAQADALLARAKRGETLDQIGAALGQPVSDIPGVTRQAPSPQLAPLLDEAFRLARPAGGKLDTGLARLAPDRYALVTVTKVEDGDPKTTDAPTRERLREQLAQMRGAVEADAYMKGLRKQYSIKVAEDRL